MGTLKQLFQDQQKTTAGSYQILFSCLYFGSVFAGVMLSISICYPFQLEVVSLQIHTDMKNIWQVLHQKIHDLVATIA